MLFRSHRHGTRSVLEQSVIGLGLGFALGDLSTVTASATTLLAATSYSRSHEREADCYAQRLLHALHMCKHLRGRLFSCSAALTTIASMIL